MNISKDEGEEFEKIRSIIDALKPWLNNSLYWQEHDAKNKPKSISKSFEDDLLAHGASISDVQSLVQKNTVEIDPIEQELEREINGRG